MQIITDPSAMQDLSLSLRSKGETICLVPTMGYFHEGHESLMKEGKERGSKLVVSRFVNPTQFGPTEDLDAYPSDQSRDISIARERGVDVLFMPETGSMYAPEHATWVEIEALSTVLCGKTRPTHFRGVCTVVAKLFHLTLPNVAIFGQKDWQQLAIIKRMTADLNFPVEIVGMPIIREHDGLALSSRNTYLQPDERAEAPFFNKGLELAERLFTQGEKNTAKIRQEVLAFWQKNFPHGIVDYLEFVHPGSLVQVETITGPTLAAAAIKVGKARLIDNRLIAG